LPLEDIVLQTILSFFIALPAGILFSYLHIPLPWMLGPLSAAMIFNACTGNSVYWPVRLRNAGLIVMGYSMGRAVTAETTQHIWASLPSMFTITLLTLLFCAAAGYITHRQTGISLPSALLGSMPGGLSQMVVLCDEIKNTDLTVVTFMQTARLLAVLFIVPFIATHSLASLPVGLVAPPMQVIEYNPLTSWPAMVLAPAVALLAYWLKLPTPFLLGPIFGAAAGVLSGFPAPPVQPTLLIVAQTFVGLYMGKNICLRSLCQLGKVLPYVIGGAVGLVGFSFGLGYLLTLLHPASLLTAFLSTAPGGMAEMGITAVILHADISTVVSYQLFRLFSILLSVPPLLKWRFCKV
jgi:uncharacterized protein